VHRAGRAGGRPDLVSTPSPTAGTRCRRRRGYLRSSSAGCATPAGSAPSAAATTRWTATALGADEARLRRDRPRRGPAPPSAARRSRRPTSAGRPTSSSADRDRRLRRRRRRRRRVITSTSAPTAPAS
jgi:hypothetical protein